MARHERWRVTDIVLVIEPSGDRDDRQERPHHRARCRHDDDYRDRRQESQREYFGKSEGHCRAASIAVGAGPFTVLSAGQSSACGISVGKTYCWGYWLGHRTDAPGTVSLMEGQGR